MTFIVVVFKHNNKDFVIINTKALSSGFCDNNIFTL